MNALTWIRDKATEIETYMLTTEEGETYRVTSFGFRGNLPTGMAADIRKLLKLLISNDSENETLLIGGQYRSDYGRCEYTRSVYERVP